MTRRLGQCGAALLAVVFAAAAPSLADETGVSAERILFGQSAAFSGPDQDFGRNMRLGIEAAFGEASARGGACQKLRV